VPRVPLPGQAPRLPAGRPGPERRSGSAPSHVVSCAAKTKRRGDERLDSLGATAEAVCRARGTISRS
jgi:hypothetical protein